MTDSTSNVSKVDRKLTRVEVDGSGSIGLGHGEVFRTTLDTLDAINPSGVVAVVTKEGAHMSTSELREHTSTVVIASGGSVTKIHLPDPGVDDPRPLCGGKASRAKDWIRRSLSCYPPGWFEDDQVCRWCAREAREQEFLATVSDGSERSEWEIDW